MHELSIAGSIVEIVSDYAQEHGALQVTAVTLRLGQLSCVHQEALEFSFDLITKDTLLEGAVLKFIDVPVAVFCPSCQQQVELPGIQKFACPVCGTATADVRQGRELEIETIEITEGGPSSQVSASAARETS